MMLPLAFQDPTPSPPQSKPSGRKGNKKVRTGCITCKVRKVKCDEGKPFCQRCVKTGRKCDGYRATPPRSTTPASSLSPIPAFGSDRESRAFDFYRTRSAKVLSGAIDLSFWGDLVLKLSLTEPAVRHAVLAVSSLHEYVDLKSRTGQELDRRFAFQEYGNSIRSLRNWAGRDEPATVPLLVCVLFICIEFLNDRTSASQMHIAQGRNIISSLPNRNSHSMELIKRSLVPIYVRLSLASFLFGNRPPTIPDHLKSWTEIPALFTCIEDARRGLYQILDEGLRFSNQASSAVFDPLAEIERQMLRQDRQQLLSQLARWNSAFTVLVSMTPHSAVGDSVQNLLRLYYHAGKIWITRALDPGELSFDDHVSDFASIISLASSIIGSLPNDATMEPFSFETELIAPVYWTATKCRHPLLRRAAVKLLTRDQMHNRRENLWHAKDVAIIAARVIEREEGDAAYSNFDDSPRSSPFSDGDSSRTTPSRQGPSGIRVDATLPPRIPGPTPSFTDPMEDIINDDGTPASSPESAGSEPSLIATAIDAIQQLDLNSVKSEGLEPPFGVPRSRRIVNTIVGPAENGGIWATYFLEPEAGQTEWKITREFLPC